jgi:hypothetical protein
MTTQTTPKHQSVTIRTGRPADAPALQRLALLDSATPIHGESLIAETPSGPVAAVAVRDGRAIADPFVPTKQIVALLEHRRDQLIAARMFSRAGSSLRSLRTTGSRRLTLELVR